MSKILEANDKSIGKMVFQADKPVLAIFGATWCEPCKALNDALQTLAPTMDYVQFVKVDVESAPQAAQQLSVRSLPMFALVQDGQIIETRQGSMTMTEIRSWCYTHLNQKPKYATIPTNVRPYHEEVAVENDAKTSAKGAPQHSKES